MGKMDLKMNLIRVSLFMLSLSIFLLYLSLTLLCGTRREREREKGKQAMLSNVDLRVYKIHIWLRKQNKNNVIFRIGGKT